MADDKNESRNENEYIGDVLKPKQRKYRKREKIIAAVTIVAFAILVVISSLLMFQDAERAVDGNVELEYPIGDGENAAANAERFSNTAKNGYFVFGDSASNDNANNGNSNITIDTQQVLP